MEREDFKIEERIHPRLLMSHFAFPSGEVAIMELIDNSIAARIPGKPLGIRILLGKDKISVTDRNGKAMGIPELRNSLIWGESEGTDVTRFYGQGGKSAMGYLGKDVHIFSTPPSLEATYEIFLEDFANRWKENLPPVNVSPRDPVFQMATVSIVMSPPNVKVNKRRLIRKISSHYAPILERGEVEIDVRSTEGTAGERVKAEKLQGELVEEFEEETNFGLVTGWIGLKKEGTAVRGGIRCYRGDVGRLIEEHQTFGFEEKADVNTDRLIGKVDNDFVPFVRDKVGFQKGTPEWEAFAEVMRRRIEPFAEMIRKQVQVPPQIEEAIPLIEKELNKLLQDTEDEFISEGRTPPSKNGVNEIILSPGDSKRRKETFAAKLTPPGDNARGKFPRKGRVTIWLNAWGGPGRAKSNQDGTVVTVNMAHPQAKASLHKGRRTRTTDFYIIEQVVREYYKGSGIPADERDAKIDFLLWRMKV